MEGAGGGGGGAGAGNGGVVKILAQNSQPIEHSTCSLIGTLFGSLDYTHTHHYSHAGATGHFSHVSCAN